MSNSIAVVELSLPKGVEVKQSKSAALEITNPIKELGKRVDKYSDCLVGSIQFRLATWATFGASSGA